MIGTDGRIAGPRVSWAADARAPRKPEADRPPEANQGRERVGGPAPAPTPEEASLATKRINEILSSSAVELRIEMRDHHFAYVLVHRETGEVVREIPPEGIERFMERYDRKSSVGVLVDLDV